MVTTEVDAAAEYDEACQHVAREFYRILFNGKGTQHGWA